MFFVCSFFVILSIFQNFKKKRVDKTMNCSKYFYLSCFWCIIFCSIFCSIFSSFWLQKTLHLKKRIKNNYENNNYVSPPLPALLRKLTKEKTKSTKTRTKILQNLNSVLLRTRKDKIVQYLLRRKKLLQLVQQTKKIKNSLDEERLKTFIPTPRRKHPRKQPFPLLLPTVLR